MSFMDKLININPLIFHMNFRINFSIFANNAIGILKVIVLNLQITLGNMNILTIW